MTHRYYIYDSRLYVNAHDVADNMVTYFWDMTEGMRDSTFSQIDSANFGAFLDKYYASIVQRLETLDIIAIDAEFDGEVMAKDAIADSYSDTIPEIVRAWAQEWAVDVE